MRWFLDPKNREEALAIVTSVTKLPKEKLAFAFTKEDFYHSPDARPELASVQKEIDEAVAAWGAARSGSRSARNTSICR